MAWGWGLVTRALVLGRNGPLLSTLSLLAPTVIVVCVPILGTHRPVRPVTGDTIAGTVGTATAGQAYGVKLAGLRALVSSLALTRANFLEKQATGCTYTAHDTVVFIGDPIISTDGCVLGRAVLRPQKHFWVPCTWVHTANVVQV